MSESTRDARDPLVDNASDREQVQFARRRIRDEEKRRLDAHRALLASGAGQLYFREQLERAGVFRSSFSTDPLQMAFNEGRRNEGLRLLVDLFTADPAAALSILTETITRESTSVQT